MKRIFSIFAIVMLAALSQADEAVKFIDRVGNYPIKGTDGIIKIEEDADQIKWSIRGASMQSPAADKNDKWFIAVVDAEDFWVYLGSGKLFHLVMVSPKETRMDHCKNLDDTKIKVPKSIKERVKQTEAEQVAGGNGS